MISNSSRKWYPVATPEEIPLREGKKVIWENNEIALFNLGGEFSAIENQCPHKKGPLADGMVSGKAVFCPLHNLKISLEHGCALNGGVGQVKTFPVKIINGKVCVAFEEGNFQECHPEERNDEGSAVSDSNVSKTDSSPNLFGSE